MRRVSKNIQILSITAAIMALLILVPPSNVEGNAQGTRTITDRIGRTVKVPLAGRGGIIDFHGSSLPAGRQ